MISCEKSPLRLLCHDVGWWGNRRWELRDRRGRLRRRRCFRFGRSRKRRLKRGGRIKHQERHLAHALGVERTQLSSAVRCHVVHLSGIQASIAGFAQQYRPDSIGAGGVPTNVGAPGGAAC
jgi:hypothetical protein